MISLATALWPIYETVSPRFPLHSLSLVRLFARVQISSTPPPVILVCITTPPLTPVSRELLSRSGGAFYASITISSLSSFFPFCLAFRLSFRVLFTRRQRRVRRVGGWKEFLVIWSDIYGRCSPASFTRIRVLAFL